jgi:hypothetical protein
MKSHEAFIELSILESKLRLLEAALNINNAASVREILQEIVPDYSPSGEIVDWIYLADFGLGSSQAS